MKAQILALFSARGRMARRPFMRAFFVLFSIRLLGNVVPVIGLVAFYATVCIQAKRLHDLRLTGWLQGLAIVPTFVWMFARVLSLQEALQDIAPRDIDPMIIVKGLDASSPWLWTMMLCAINELVFVIWLMRAPGDPGANRHGEPPAAAPTSTFD